LVDEETKAEEFEADGGGTILEKNKKSEVHFN
jgi:hypothetical protein